MPIPTVILLSAICSLVQSSEFHDVAPGAAPVVTAASSQYFERTFNRLVAAPVQHVFPVAPPPPVIVDAKTTITPVIPTNPPQPVPADPNIAIAIATAQAAAPVATILLPPYPFGLPPTFGFIPSPPPFNVPSENPNKESTTPKPTTQATTEKDLEVAPLPSNNDNSFAQALPSNENVNFRQYLAPPLPVQPLPQPARPYQPPRPDPRPLLPQPLPQLPPVPQVPQKLKTTVEVVPVPLTYIAPPPEFTHSHIHAHHHGHHGHHGHHAHIKVSKHAHYHTYIPKKAKIIIRPVRVHTIRVPARLVAYKATARSSVPRYPQNALRVSGPKEREPTTFRPLNRPVTKPPRL
ncbi:uncharacterized protein [Epargyreus clarus]|uniref:uncharacterized protein n=1 Tax=Epargyreus clarus TaxID=520877 RepID=UPI003C2E1CB5